MKLTPLSTLPDEAPAMRLPRFRFTIRRMMVAVAIVALLIGIYQMQQRRQVYLALAAPHEKAEAFHAELSRDIAGDPAMAASLTVTALLPDGSAVRLDGHGPGRKIYYPPDAKVPGDEATANRLAEMCRRESEKERRLRIKYERAARYPWLSVAPDPE